MTDERYNELMSNEDLTLTPDEVNEGWFVCQDCDGLLTNESKCCLNAKLDDSINEIIF